MRPRRLLRLVTVAAVALAAGACGSGSGAEAGDGKAAFQKAACGSCHALADANATGAVGPDLDELKPNKLKVETFVRNGVPPTMPSFRGTLSDAEIEAVADYVSEVTGGNEDS